MSLLHNEVDSSHYSETSLIWTLMGQKKLISGVEIYARVVVGVGKGVFLEVSSVQGCPYRGVPL